MRELVSFVIPTHNCVTYLPAAVDSARAQKYENVEIVVVDDGSTDETKQYLDWLEKNEQRAKVIRNPENLGRSRSRNIGNQAASGKFIYVLDADDMAHDKRVDLTIGKLQKFQFVHGGAEHIDCLGNRLGRLGTDVFSLDKVLKGPNLESFITHSAVCYSKEFALKYPYPEGKLADLGLDDWGQQIKAASDGVRFEYVPNVICHYRHIQSSISAKRDFKECLEAKKEFISGLGLKLGTA